MNNTFIQNNSCIYCGVLYTDEEISLYLKWHLNCKNCGKVYNEHIIDDTYLQLSFF